MPLEVTDERVSAAAARLHDGGWCFSARQLYYAVCADVETAPVRVASGEVGLGVLLVMVGAITGQRLLLEILGLAGLLLVVVGVVTRIQERRPAPSTRSLALAYTDFAQRFVADGTAGYPGLIAPGPTTRSAGEGAPLVVCDRDETAAVIAANLESIGQVDVAARDAEPADVQGRRVVVLHDCDPAGCGLVAELRDRGADVVDAGINPAELAGRRLQLLEGAPARLPRDLSGLLDAEQIEWLRSGRRLECATESPEQLAQRVRAALARA